MSLRSPVAKELLPQLHKILWQIAMNVTADISRKDTADCTLLNRRLPVFKTGFPNLKLNPYGVN